MSFDRSTCSFFFFFFFFFFFLSKSFTGLGRDLVDWLLDNVHGIRDRKAARSFASQLLTQGYIKHVVNKLTFTEKCYYVFDGRLILSIYVWYPTLVCS